MVALSRALNPECEHFAGDMRTLRLGKTFDAVLVHDAIAYMLTVEDLRAAAETAFLHTRSGGAAIFAPDCFRETFADRTELLSEDEPGRSLRGIMWSWDPDPADDTYRTEFAFLLRDGTDMTAVHDTHVEGLFAKSIWEQVLGEVGFSVETMARPIDEERSDEVFLCRKP